MSENENVQINAEDENAENAVNEPVVSENAESVAEVTVESVSEPEVAESESEGVVPAEISEVEIDGNTGLIKKRSLSLTAKKALSGYVFVLPFILGILLIYIPILLDSVWFSLGNMRPTIIDGVGTTYLEFVGFKHYSDAFANTSYVTALVSGIQKLVFEVPAIIIFSLFIAVVLNQKMLGRALFRAIFFLPVIVSTGVMESINASDLMSNMAQGGINDGSGASTGGIISTLDIQNLFSSMKVGGELVTYVVGLVNNIYQIINYSGVQMLIFLAGLQSISASIYEACRIDGATAWETFWKVTFPMISPMILVNAVYTVIDAFTRSQNPTMLYIANVGDQHLATAMSWIYFLIIILIVAVVAAIASTFIFYQRRD